MDFDGDGRLDLLSGSNCCATAAFHLFRRKPDGSWAPEQRLEMTPPGQLRRPGGHGFVSAADYNGDGVPDLLSVAGGPRIAVGLGPFREGGPITVSREIDRAPAGWVGGFAVADWDRDGKPDLLVDQGNSEAGKAGIYWYKNLGGPGLTKLAEGKLLLEVTPDMDLRAFCVCDWNGDGWPGMIVTRQDLVPGGPDGRGEWRGSVWLYPRE